MERPYSISLRFLLMVVIVLWPISPVIIKGQKVTVSEGAYTLCMTENMTIAEAKHLALKNAKIKAIEDVFGTEISQLNSTAIKSNGVNSNVDFRSHAESFIKGEWIETLDVPVFENAMDENGNMWISCTVKGRVREIIASNVNIDVKIFRNGTDYRFESRDFKDGDDMYVYVCSSMDIHVTAYFLDEKSGLAYRVLPYIGSQQQSYRILGNSPEVLFSRAFATSDLPNIVDEYQLNCDGDIEFYEIWLLYSTSPLPSPLIRKAIGEVPSLPIIDFEKWLAITRLRDTSIGTINLDITVRSRE